MKRLIVLLVIFIAAGAQAQSAPPSPAAKIARITELGFLEGHWEGSGWMMFGPNQKMEFTSTEKVERKLDGVVLVVQGKHAAGERVVHNALGIFSWDEAADTFRFKTYLANGLEGDFEAQLSGNGELQWSYEQPGRGHIRYTIEITDDGRWHEIGEMTRDDGENWFQFFEMTLAKK